MEITFFVVWTLFCVLTGWITGDHNARRRRSKIVDSLNQQVSYLWEKVERYKGTMKRDDEIISSLNNRLQRLKVAVPAFEEEEE